MKKNDIFEGILFLAAIAICVALSYATAYWVHSYCPDAIVAGCMFFLAIYLYIEPCMVAMDYVIKLKKLIDRESKGETR